MDGVFRLDFQRRQDLVTAVSFRCCWRTASTWSMSSDKCSSLMPSLDTSFLSKWTLSSQYNPWSYSMFEKLRYGLASAISQLDQEPSDRIDPMSEVTFQKPPSTMPILHCFYNLTMSILCQVTKHALWSPWSSWRLRISGFPASHQVYLPQVWTKWGNTEVIVLIHCNNHCHCPS